MKKHYVSLLIICSVAVQCLAGDLWLPAIFSDHMVLQRDINTPVWGKARPNTFINIEIDNIKTSTISDHEGKWLVRLPVHPAGGPFELKITSDEIKVFKNVMYGDVWFASGQSNMAMSVEGAKDAKTEIENSDFPNIRLFTVTTSLSNTPQTEVKGGPWMVCNKYTVNWFSAVAYFFGRKLYLDKNVPIGLINSSWGGTLAEAWTSQEVVSVFPENKKQIEELHRKNITDEILAQNEKNMNLRMDITVNSNEGLKQNVHTIKYNDKNWKTMNVPKSLDQSEVGTYLGAVWFRRKVQLSKEYQGKDLILKIGKVGMRDVTYFNGVKVGESTWTLDLIRTYTIPANLVKKGTNVVVVRDAVSWDTGGLKGPADSMSISVPGNTTQKISLSGDWKYSVDIEPKVPKTYDYLNEPGLIFNAMVNPVIPYGIKGVIWYQGEGNAGNPAKYEKLLPMMISDWRVRWGQGYFPFLIVQLTSFTALQKEPVENGWAELRNAQLKTTRYPNVGMVTTIDVGDALDIHPTNKQDIGKRLALAAEKIAYGDNIVYSGPSYQSMEIEGNSVRLKFSNTGAGMVTKDGQLKGFAIAGADQKYYWADGKIEGNEIIVSSLQVPVPMNVRYAWANNPIFSLYNKEGLPASPFSTEE